MKQTFAFLSGFAWLGFRSAAAAITQTEATTETSEAIVTFTTTLTIPQIEKREISKFEYPRYASQWCPSFGKCASVCKCAGVASPL